MSQSQSPSRPSVCRVRRGALLAPSDRRMLQAVRDNLSHLRHAAGTAAGTGTLPRRLDQASALQDTSQNNGSSSVSGFESSRLNYNKKAMDKIRQSLQSYHVTPASYDTTSHNNLIQQVMILNKVSSSRMQPTA